MWDCVDVTFLGEVETIFGVICGLSFYRMMFFSNRGSELASICNLSQNISDHMTIKTQTILLGADPIGPSNYLTIKCQILVPAASIHDD